MEQLDCDRVMLAVINMGSFADELHVLAPVGPYIENNFTPRSLSWRAAYQTHYPRTVSHRGWASLLSPYQNLAR